MSSKTHLEDIEQPNSFKRIANSIRRKVTHVFPRRNSADQDFINEYLNQKLHGTGKANFDRQQDPGYVEVRLDRNQIIQMLKDGKRGNLGGRVRSNSCPKEEPWLSSVISLSTIPVTPEIKNPPMTINDYYDIKRGGIPDSTLDRLSVASTVPPQDDAPGKEHRPTFH